MTVISKLLKARCVVKGIGLDKQHFKSKTVNIFLPIIFKICFGYSKEPSQ